VLIIVNLDGQSHALPRLGCVCLRRLRSRERLDIQLLQFKMSQYSTTGTLKISRAEKTARLIVVHPAYLNESGYADHRRTLPWCPLIQEITRQFSLREAMA
jgi:hypothetical protein